jgi:phosphate-selective porin OprO/OprP
LLGSLLPAARAQTDAQPAPAAASEEADENGQNPVVAERKKFLGGATFETWPRPTLRVGEWLRVDFRLKFQHDFRTFDPEISGDEGEVANLNSVRVGIEGDITRHFEYEIDREVRNGIADTLHLRTRQTHALWRDVYGNFRYFRRFQIRAGQFKIPFGMDQLQSSKHSDFVFRSLIGGRLAPGRDVGIEAHGRLFARRLQYQTGIFIHDGWKAHLGDYERSGQRTFAGRLSAPPFTFIALPRFLRFLRDIELGGAFTENPVTEGLRSLRGRTWVHTHNYFQRINVRGHRLRLGTELNWMTGPFSIKAEVIRVRDQRLGQGLRGQDLPDLLSRGWYFSGTWLITGEKKVNAVRPKRDFLTGGGIGAVEIGSRYEQIRFGSSEHPGTPSRSTRAANIFATSERVGTFGINWYLNRYMRIQFNAIREWIEDVRNAPIPGQDTYWSRYVRMQFIL